MLFPIFILVFYCKSFANWSKRSFRVKYGALFEGLRTKKRSSLAYPIIFILRRFVLVFLAIVTKELLFVQLSVMILISMGQTWYLINFRPFKQPLLLKLDIMNEVTIVFLVDVLTCFSQANTEPIDYEMDIIFLVGLFGNIAVHLFFLVRNTAGTLKRKCR